ncbi:helix-turn-helix domain-containing protein [Pseudonocardia aurantiaca]|uniref:TetR/AcrR family transcriptional regulator n=1 Tax=Pseudonocardia aurantiaca TaxID=75290 RepID=A0ABW4FPE0_9PSEU
MAGSDVAGARVGRVLDAAGELLVRWGYQRVTIDEVARHAGIGKGTVYLHFRTKDALFLAVLLRAQAGVAERAAQRAEADPEHAMPARLVRTLYLELSADPVLRAMYLSDVEILGRLAHEAADTIGELTAHRDHVLDEHLRLLREAGCLRADLTLPEMRYTFDAIATGFIVVDGFSGSHRPPPLAVEERADLLERAIAAAIQVPEPPAAELARVAPAVAQLYRSLLDHIDHDEWRPRGR